MSFATRRTRCILVKLVLSSLLLLPACENTDPKPEAGPPVNGNIVITDASNFKAKLTLDIPRIRTAEKKDLHICWGGITKDMLERGVNAATDINSVNFLVITGLSADDIVQRLKEERDFSTKVEAHQYYTSSASSTCAYLSQFSGLTPDQLAVASKKTYMILFATGTRLGVGGKSMAFIEPAADSSNEQVDAPNGPGIVTFNADVTTIATVHAPKDGPFVVDWSQVTTNGLGNKIKFDDINSLQLGFYQGETTQDLQDRFKQLDQIATTLYEMPIAREVVTTSADLKGATSQNSGPFAGFNRTDGVWALALRCTDCLLPVPTLVAILTPT